MWTISSEESWCCVDRQVCQMSVSQERYFLASFSSEVPKVRRMERDWRDVYCIEKVMRRRKWWGAEKWKGGGGEGGGEEWMLKTKEKGHGGTPRVRYSHVRDVCQQGANITYLMKEEQNISH